MGVAVVNMYEDCVICAAENEPAHSPADAVRIIMIMIRGGTEGLPDDAEGAFDLMVHDLCFFHRRELDENVRKCRAEKAKG